MLLVAPKLSHKSYSIQINRISQADDAIAGDVLHHNLRWAKAKRWAEAKAKPVENCAKALADIQLLHIMETNMLQNRNNTLGINVLNETY